MLLHVGLSEEVPVKYNVRVTWLMFNFSPLMSLVLRKSTEINAGKGKIVCLKQVRG